MKKKKFNISFIRAITYVTLIFISLSCTEDFFNVIPGDKVLPENHYNTAIEIDIAYMGVFTMMQDLAVNYVVTNALLADLVEITDNANVDFRNVSKHNFADKNPLIDATPYYRLIISANEVLANLDSTLQDPDFTIIKYEEVYGNLVGLRSWAYFTLARLYNQVAYIPDNMSKLPQGGDLVYLTRHEIMDTLIQHLNAEVLNSDMYSTTGTTGINKNALMGEIQLEKGDYALAATYLIEATNIVNRLYYKLDVAYSKDNWGNIFKNSSDQRTTVLNAVPFSLDNQQGNPLESWMSYHYDYVMKPSDEIINLFKSQKTKLGVEGDLYRGLGVSYDTLENNYFINKYSLDASHPFSSAVVIYRAADIHLMLAEALNRNGESDAAMKILNDGYKTLPFWTRTLGVRGRVYLEAKPIGGSIEEIEDMIMEERAMELAFEGKRWFDLMRVARRRNNNDYLAEKVSIKYYPEDPDFSAQLRNKLGVEENWYLPVVK